jgi:predicted metal-dependent HD superfamily phosphohydrolase
VYHDLHQKYTEYRRSYHSLEHILDLLCLLHLLEPVLKEEAFFHQTDYEEIMDELILLIYFHDVVYEPGSKNNEEESSYYFLNVAKPTRTTLIPEHIKATKEHRDLTVSEYIPGGDVERIRNEIYLRKLLFDLDLASLGFSPSLFQEYRQKVEEEYLGVPKELIKEGTKEFFKKFMQDRPVIYQTKTFRQIFEEQAQRNIKGLIDDSQ